MFLETVKSAGLAHLSYVLGAGGVAAVIDPRRDCQVYLDIARAHGCAITHILETHRNEDYVSGAPLLKALTGGRARILHGAHSDAPIRYAEPARDGDEITLGAVRLRVLETPGHTNDSLGFVVFDEDSGEDALGVFTGDTLFVGDVGRTDFYPDAAEDTAGHLFDSLRRLIALGDQCMVWPAHGAGSVCGAGMADREVSTIGLERRNNPMLKIKDRDAFIRAKVAEHHDFPPYFHWMEKLNSDGIATPAPVAAPPPLRPPDLDKAARTAVVVDVRSAAAWLGAHVPGSLAIPEEMIPALAGWMLKPEDDIVLIAEDAPMAARAATHLARIGYDRVLGHFAAGMAAWAVGARPFEALPVVDVAEVERRMSTRPEGWDLLDVRSGTETAEGAIAGSRHAYVGELPAALADLPRNRHYTVMCASGARSTVAASVLSRAGYPHVDVFLGSMKAWLKRDNPVEAE